MMTMELIMKKSLHQRYEKLCICKTLSPNACAGNFIKHSAQFCDIYFVITLKY